MLKWSFVRGEERRTEKRRGEMRRKGVFGCCENKVSQNSFIRDEAQLNKQHLEASNSPTAQTQTARDRTGAHTQMANRLTDREALTV